MSILEQRDNQLAELDRLKAAHSGLCVQATAANNKVNLTAEKIREFKSHNIAPRKHHFNPAELDEVSREKYDRLIQENEEARIELTEAEKGKQSVNERIGELETVLQKPGAVAGKDLDEAREKVHVIEKDIEVVEASIQASQKAEQEAQAALQAINIEAERVALEDLRAKEALGKVKKKDIDIAVKEYDQKQFDSKAHARAMEDQKALQAGLRRNLFQLKDDREEAIQDVERLMDEILMVNAEKEQHHMAKALEAFARAYRRCVGYDRILKSRGKRVGVFGPWKKDFDIPRPVALRDESKPQTSAGKPLFSTASDVDPAKEADQILKAL